MNTHRDGRQIPAILFTKGGGLWLEAMAETGYDALGLDWQTDIGNARARVGDKVALQGNMDPITLYASAGGYPRKMSAKFCNAMVMVRGMYLIWDMAFCRTSIPSMLKPWSMLCGN